MTISMIAAIGENNELGIDNCLIWNIPSDLKLFKEITNGKTIIMGRKTFESIGRVLPNRKHIVLTNDKEFSYPDVEVCHNIFDIVKKYYNNDEEVFIIGGAKIYKEFLNFSDKLYLTEVCASEGKADAYFPTFNKKGYDVEELVSNTDNNLCYKQLKYTRRR